MKKNKRVVQGIIVTGVVCILCIGSFFVIQSIGSKGEQGQNQNVIIKETVLSYNYNQGKQNDDIDEVVMTVSGNDALQNEILLVNKDNPLPEDYEVELVKLPDGVNYAAEEAYESLCDMLEAGQNERLKFEICSSYRDVERQQELFDEDVKVLMRRGYSYDEAYEEVAKETMPPGYSEHSTGLAFDIVSRGYQMLDSGQEKTKENKWLQDHCAEYGFILRYPKGKEDITSINYESWHFRYVGKEAAEYIMENGITLEEYLEP